MIAPCQGPKHCDGYRIQKPFSPGELIKLTERDVTTFGPAEKRLERRFKKDLDLAEKIRKLSEAVP
jgi:phage FluMu protein gp41